MRSQGVLALLSTALLGRVGAENAPVVSNNPSNVVYTATLPDQPFFADAAIDGNVKGSISARAPADGVGIKYTVKFSNLPSAGGPFLYHIHQKAATDGNCNTTMAHLDPENRGESPPCDRSQLASCQVGDLSGKYGTINSDPFVADFLDPYTSTTPGNAAFIGNLAFVIHYANKTRITCANFGGVDVAVNTTGSSTVAPTGSSATGAPSATSTTAPFPGAGSMTKVSISMMGGVVAAMLLAL